MGIYVFNRETLADALAGSEADFGKHVIPRLIETRRVYAFRHEGYWEDIGTIRVVLRGQSRPVRAAAAVQLLRRDAPIYTHARFLPATKIIKSRIERSILADGCIINDAGIEHSVVGVRSRIESGATIRDALIMGQDYYETARPGARPRGADDGYRPRRLDRGTIVDKNARIGDNVRITPDGKPAFLDGANYYIRDGVVIIPKGGVIMSGTVI